MGKPRILLIDDEKLATDLISARLEANGFEVSAANSPEAALDFLKTNKPDLILLDLIMPGMNGYEVLDKIRAGNTTKDIPVIMLTAKMVQADKVKALNKGLDDYMTKPYDSEELLARINAVLKRSKSSAV